MLGYSLVLCDSILFTHCHTILGALRFLSSSAHKGESFPSVSLLYYWDQA